MRPLCSAMRGSTILDPTGLTWRCDMPAPQTTSTGAEKMYPTPRSVLMSSGAAASTSILRRRRKI